jgi:type II secretory pathway pseudopilin PulG
MDGSRYFGGTYNLILRGAKAFEPIARLAGAPIDLNRLPRAKNQIRHLGVGRMAVTLDNTGLGLSSEGSMGNLDASAIGVAAVAVVAAIAIPNLLEARKAANETAAISTMRTLVTCQSLYRDADKDGDGNANFAPDLQSLWRHGQLIDDVLASGVKQGYHFQMEMTDEGFAWHATAVPMDAKSGTRSFYVDESGVIRHDQWGDVPTVESPPIGW